jgi:tetratricopeptide (TPR) repeat protein
MVAAKVGYWPSQSEFQIKGVAAWIALAEGQHAQALALMTEAADLEEASDKHPVTPGNVIPSRELLGEMLMALNRPADALVEFQRSLKRDPNRYQTIAGAARAARATGAKDEAAKLYRELVALGDKAQSRRPELAEAKSFLGK